MRAIKDKNIFSVDTENFSYVFCVDSKGLVRHLYFGDYVSDLDDFDVKEIKNRSSNDSYVDIAMEELSFFGGLRYKEPSIKLNFSDGTRDLKLVYKSFEIESDKLTIFYEDKDYKFIVKMIFSKISDFNLIERNIILENNENEPVFIDSIYSAEFNFDDTDYYITTASGGWTNENIMLHEKLEAGKRVFDGRRGITGHCHNPYFFLDKGATEDVGEVYFATLAHSGNFKTTAEVTPYDTTRILMGINDFDFSYKLDQDCAFETPKVIFGYTKKGFGEISNIMKEFSLKNVLPKRGNNKLRKVIYNSWYATGFDVNYDGQIKLAEIAADLGVELFVVDDGWFHGRNNDLKGLGDWFCDKIKFPQGLSPMVEGINKLGMDFGIWIEPEMVNPASDLYINHPEWVYKFEKREGTQARHQLVLNFTMSEVRDYLVDCFHNLLTEYNIKYIKWDMNRPLSEVGAINLNKDQQKEIWLRHTEGVFDVLKRLQDLHPDVLWEGCASGGGRVNYKDMEYYDIFWASDNTDPIDRLSIQYGYSYIYPPKAMLGLTTDISNKVGSKNPPMEFRMHATMMGALGIGNNLYKTTEADLKIIKENISLYKIIRKTVQEGDYYRLASIDKSSFHAIEYVKDGNAVLFLFMISERRYKNKKQFKLKGLDKNKTYIYKNKDNEYIKKSGEYLMNVGLPISMFGDYSSQILVFNKEN